MRDLKFGALTANVGPVLAPIELEGFAGREHQRHVGAAPRRLFRSMPIFTPCPGESCYAFIGAIISQLHQISMHLLHCPPLFA